MTGKPEIFRLLPVLGALLCSLAGCQTTPTDVKPQPKMVVGPVDTSAIYAAGTVVPLNPNTAKPASTVATLPTPNSPSIALPRVVEIARSIDPGSPVVVSEATPRQQAETLAAGKRSGDDIRWVASVDGSDIPLGPARLPRLRTSILIHEENDTPSQIQSVESENRPVIPVAATEAVTGGPTTQEPPIRNVSPPTLIVPGVPVPAIAREQSVPQPPAQLPSMPATTVTPGTGGSIAEGPITIGGQAITFDALAKIVDGSSGGYTEAGCASCGDCGPGRPCPAGGQKCEPFPDGNAFTRAIGIAYEMIVCPDPCYQPKWEAVADSAFFVDPARPVSNTRFVWDYANHFAYPDRAEFFWAASPKGPSPTDSLKAVPYLNYNQLTLVTEIATGGGGASVAIAMPYRSWDAEPFAHSAAGFSDMSITAKTLLVDTELFLCSMQMRTYVPIGNVTTGLGDGHVTLEPGLIFGLRLSPSTYMQAEVQEWIPIGGDTNSEGAFLQWGLSVNQVLWQPVKDVKLIGTLEFTGYSFQAGQFTDPVLGPQKLSGQNNMAIGNGYRLFIGKFDVGLAGNFGVTGKYMAQEAMQFDVRFRY